MFNPVKLMQLKSMKDQFSKNHPKFTKFLTDASKTALVEGSVIDIQIRTPDNKQLCSNFKIKKEDMELLEAVKSLKK